VLDAIEGNKSDRLSNFHLSRTGTTLGEVHQKTLKTSFTTKARVDNIIDSLGELLSSALVELDSSRCA
jgi:hypothetical protein